MTLPHPTIRPVAGPVPGPSERLVFNRPFTTGREQRYVQEAVENLHLSAGGPFSERCARRLRELTGSRGVLLTHSATGALEMAALLTGAGPGLEVVMPSFTFPSTATAVALRGAVPVFVDVREDTLTVDVSQVERALGPRTRAIVPVHYAGVACDMDELGELARARRLALVEDAAQGLDATYRGRPLGSFGDAAALSFHETKNVMCGEGGALLVNDESLFERAELLHEKGTDRHRFGRGEVREYRWQDLGSSFAMSELSAAFLWAQLEAVAEIGQARHAIWDLYHEAFLPLEAAGLLRRPVVPPDRGHNALSYFVVLADPAWRRPLLTTLEAGGIQAISHYVPLHDSPAGRRFGRAVGELTVTTSMAARLVRLPLWIGMTEADVDRVACGVEAALAGAR
jgi:dTDP-4-amino-4,6-dideoxygalactose transaminase